jgi:hypothetical protein
MSLFANLFGFSLFGSTTTSDAPDPANVLPLSTIQPQEKAMSTVQVLNGSVPAAVQDILDWAIGICPRMPSTCVFNHIVSQSPASGDIPASRYEQDYLTFAFADEAVNADVNEILYLPHVFLNGVRAKTGEQPLPGSKALHTIFYMKPGAPPTPVSKFGARADKDYMFGGRATYSLGDGLLIADSPVGSVETNPKDGKPYVMSVYSYGMFGAAQFPIWVAK